jgi:EAL domain-containing protein (putative c-di-GMP-specific phosphodiesterase class I)
LRRASLGTNKLKPEITETMVMENELCVAGVLRDLGSLGVRIPLDDFGSVYSSLNYVKDLLVDGLKIDKSFIDGLGEAEVNGAIVRLIADFAHTLGLKVTAEGMETARQVTSLAAMRCDLAQGFYFSKPLPGEAAGALVATNASWWVPR